MHLRRTGPIRLARMCSRLLARLAGLLLASALIGCTPAPEAQLADYHRRVATVLEQEPLPLQPATLAPAPRAASLALPETDLRIGLLDFLRLSRCELSRALGERNSALGKVAPPSQRLLLSKAVLLTGPACAEQITAERPALAAELKSLLAIKLEERQHIWWNAWLTSDEWRRFTRDIALPLPLGGPEPAGISAGIAALEFALHQGYQWRQQHFDGDDTRMEFHQQQLMASELVGRWRQSQRWLTALNDATAQVIRQRLRDRPLCRGGKPSQRGKYLHNVFSEFFIGVVQPYQSRVHRLTETVLALLERFPEHAPAPESYLNWLRQLRDERARLNASHKAHIEAWQAILQQCGLIPGSARSFQVSGTTMVTPHPRLDGIGGSCAIHSSAQCGHPIQNRRLADALRSPRMFTERLCNACPAAVSAPNRQGRGLT